MGLFDMILRSKSSESGILSNPGDKLEARVTDSNRRVLKYSQDHGASKYSCTEYSNGTRVETRTTKRAK